MSGAGMRARWHVDVARAGTCKSVDDIKTAWKKIKPLRSGGVARKHVAAMAGCNITQMSSSGAAVAFHCAHHKDKGTPTCSAPRQHAWHGMPSLDALKGHTGSMRGALMLESNTCTDGCAALEPWLESHMHTDGCAVASLLPAHQPVASSLPAPCQVASLLPACCQRSPLAPRCLPAHCQPASLPVHRCLSSLQNNPLRERAVITARAQWLGCTVCNGLGGYTACSVANLRTVEPKQCSKCSDE